MPARLGHMPMGMLLLSCLCHAQINCQLLTYHQLIAAASCGDSSVEGPLQQPLPCQLQLTVLVPVRLCFLAAAPRDQLRFLKDEIQETKKAVKNLDEAVAKALSFREKSSRLLEEAHRALSRLEQVRLGWTS